MTNVMPVIGKADRMTPEKLWALKHTLLTTLETLEPRPFHFATSASELRSPGSSDSPTYPYAVSSALSADDDNMDASLMMSPDYIQPLLASDLAALTKRLFDPETAAHLRHTSARKLLQWRRSMAPPLTRGLSLPPQNPALHSTSTKITSSTSSALLPTHAYIPTISGLGLLTPRPSPSPFHLARLADHTDREERLTQVRLARWAGDLQRSLLNERERYAQLQRDEQIGRAHV